MVFDGSPSETKWTSFFILLFHILFQNSAILNLKSTQQSNVFQLHCKSFLSYKMNWFGLDQPGQ